MFAFERGQFHLLWALRASFVWCPVADHRPRSSQNHPKDNDNAHALNINMRHGVWTDHKEHPENHHEQTKKIGQGTHNSPHALIGLDYNQRKNTDALQLSIIPWKRRCIMGNFFLP
jgi:hypothetical protein